MTDHLTFHGVALEIIDQHGQPWLRAADIAHALGYSRDDAISRIYARNASEFTSSMCQTVKLTVSRNGGDLLNEIRIFSLRGAHLLAMFARTDRAKEFRRWVLDVLDQRAAAVPVSVPAPDGPAIDVVIRGALAAIATSQPGRPDWFASYDQHMQRLTLHRLKGTEVMLDYNDLPERIRAGCIYRTETLAAIMTATAEQLTERARRLAVDAVPRAV